MGIPGVATQAAELTEVNWRDLRAGRTRMLSALFLGTLIYWFLIAVGIPGPALFLAIGGLALAFTYAYHLANRHSLLCASVLPLTVVAAVLTLSWLNQIPLAWFLLPIAVVAAGVVLHPDGALVLAFILVLVTLVVKPLPYLEVRLLVVNLALTGATVWLGLREVYAQLDAAWQMSSTACNLAREVQDRQSELNRALKTLHLTNHLLQSTNRELEIARREAEEARALKAQFAASVSHELRTPLSIILGFTEVMTRSPELYGDVVASPKLCRDISEVRRAARYLSELVDDILDLARIDALKMPISRTPGRIEEVLQEAVGTLRGILEGRPIDLIVSISPDLPVLHFDRTRISQVLLNLLTNAARFTVKGSISVEARLADDDVVVSVRDTGAGIPAEELPRIFDEFHQVNGGDRRSGEGKGLGLAISKRIIQLHDGKIWCESELGKGSSFHFSLPIKLRNTSRLARRNEAGLPRDPRPRSIVVLDRSPVAAAYLRRRLEGFEVHWAAQPQESYALVKEYRPDALVVNSDTDGATGQERISLPKGVPIVSLPLPSEQWLRQDERFDLCLTKPFALDSLHQVIEGLPPGRDVLVVDDDRSFVALMRRALESLAPERGVRAAYNGQAALAAVPKHRPALVLLDIAMPGLDGFAVADAIRRDLHAHDIRIAAVTGTTMRENAIAVEGQEFSVRLGRGFSGEELESLLQATLESIRPTYVT